MTISKSVYVKVPCTTCGRAPGQICLTPGGELYSVSHSQRKRLYYIRAEKKIPFGEPPPASLKGYNHPCRKVSCSQCLAAAGQSCRTHTGAPVKGDYHKARKDRYARGQAQRS